MFHEVDPILGPEMRSTGEVLGMADSFELAFHKAQEAAQQLLPQEGTVLISVSDPDKTGSAGSGARICRLGFKLESHRRDAAVPFAATASDAKRF